MVIIGLHCDKHISCWQNIRSAWRKRIILGASILQIFDQATDIAVLMVWWVLAIEEQKADDNGTGDIEDIDMTTLVDISVLSLLLSRLFMVNMAALAYMYRQADGYDIILAFFDLYVIKQVYVAFRRNQLEPTVAMRMAQLFEAMIESFPQIFLQSVFIIRTWGKIKDEVYNNDNADQTWLFAFSIITSALSIVNKFIVWDKMNHAFDDTAKHARAQPKVQFFCFVFVLVAVSA